MRTSLSVLLLAALPVVAPAQSVTYESVRLSELLLDETWSVQEQTIPTVIAALEAQLRQGGASDRVTTVFPREVRKALTRENIGKATAVFFSQKLSIEETRDLTAFMQSTLGRKYLSLSREMAGNSGFIAQILKQACSNSARELDASDRRALEPVCGR